MFNINISYNSIKLRNRYTISLIHDRQYSSSVSSSNSSNNFIKTPQIRRINTLIHQLDTSKPTFIVHISDLDIRVEAGSHIWHSRRSVDISKDYDWLKSLFKRIKTSAHLDIVKGVENVRIKNYSSDFKITTEYLKELAGVLPHGWYVTDGKQTFYSICPKNEELIDTYDIKVMPAFPRKLQFKYKLRKGKDINHTNKRSYSSIIEGGNGGDDLNTLDQKIAELLAKRDKLVKDKVDKVVEKDIKDLNHYLLDVDHEDNYDAVDALYNKISTVLSDPSIDIEKTKISSQNEAGLFMLDLVKLFQHSFAEFEIIEAILLSDLIRLYILRNHPESDIANFVSAQFAGFTDLSPKIEWITRTVHLKGTVTYEYCIDLSHLSIDDIKLVKKHMSIMSYELTFNHDKFCKKEESTYSYCNIIYNYRNSLGVIDLKFWGRRVKYKKSQTGEVVGSVVPNTYHNPVCALLDYVEHYEKAQIELYDPCEQSPFVLLQWHISDLYPRGSQAEVSNIHVNPNSKLLFLLAGFDLIRP